MRLTSPRTRWNNMRLQAGLRLRQRGAMAINMLLMLIGLIGMLGLIEIGYLYWARRDTQKVADLAALSGVQQLPDCAAAVNAANTNALQDNTFSGSLTTNACGNWDPVTHAASADHFVTPAANGTAVNALKVVAQRPIVPIWGFAKIGPNISATAVAINQGSPIASFSVGSSLLDLNPSSPLGSLLSSALGTSLGLQLLSYNGIANARISLLDLVNQLNLNVGTVDGVLSTQLTVAQLLNAYVGALTQSPDSVSVDLNFVQQQIALINAQLGNIPINLGQILNVDANTQDPNTALKVDANALDLINAVLLAADGNNGLALPATTVSVPGIASVTLMLGIVEPPQLGVGGVGTVAHTAQIRLMLDISLLNNALFSNVLQGGDSEALVEVPLYLEVAPTDATLTALDCHVPAANGTTTNNVTIETQPGLLNLFLGKLPASAFSNTSESWASLIAAGQFDPILNVNLLGLPIATVDIMSSVAVATTPADTHTFAVNPNVPVAQQAGMTWPPPNTTQAPQLGTLVTSLLTSLNLQTGLSLLGSPPTLNLGPLVSGLANLLQPVLSPLLDSLDTLLVTPLLQILGVEIATAEINLRSVTCNTGPQLVY